EQESRSERTQFALVSTPPLAGCLHCFNLDRICSRDHHYSLLVNGARLFSRTDADPGPAAHPRENESEFAANTRHRFEQSGLEPFAAISPTARRNRVCCPLSGQQRRRLAWARPGFATRSVFH